MTDHHLHVFWRNYLYQPIGSRKSTLQLLLRGVPLPSGTHTNIVGWNRNYIVTVSEAHSHYLLVFESKDVTVAAMAAESRLAGIVRPDGTRAKISVEAPL